MVVSNVGTIVFIDGVDIVRVRAGELLAALDSESLIRSLGLDASVTFAVKAIVMSPGAADTSAADALVADSFAATEVLRTSAVIIAAETIFLIGLLK